MTQYPQPNHPTPASQLRNTINQYLDPNYGFRFWDGMLNAPGERWIEAVDVLPDAVTAQFPELLPDNTVPGTVSEVSYYLLVSQAYTPDNDELARQGQEIIHETGQAEGVAVFAQVILARNQSFVPTQETISGESDSSSIRGISDNAVYGVALDTDSFGNPQYVVGKRLFRGDSLTQKEPEQTSETTQISDEELTAVSDFLIDQVIQHPRNQAGGLNPEDFL